MENENKKKYFLNLNNSSSTETNETNETKVKPKSKTKNKKTKLKKKSKQKIKPKIKESIPKIKTKIVSLPPSLPAFPSGNFSQQLVKPPVKEKRKYVRKTQAPAPPAPEPVKEPVKEKRKYVRKTQTPEQVKPKIIDVINKQSYEPAREAIINKEDIPIKKEDVKKEVVKKELKDFKPLIEDIKPMIEDTKPIIQEVKTKRTYTKKPIIENIKPIIEEINIKPEEITIKPLKEKKKKPLINDGFLNNNNLVENFNSSLIIEKPKIQEIKPIEDINKYIGENNVFLDNNFAVSSTSYKDIIKDGVDDDANLILNKKPKKDKLEKMTLQESKIKWAYDIRNPDRENQIEILKELAAEDPDNTYYQDDLKMLNEYNNLITPQIEPVKYNIVNEPVKYNIVNEPEDIELDLNSEPKNYNIVNDIEDMPIYEEEDIINEYDDNIAVSKDDNQNLPIIEYKTDETPTKKKRGRPKKSLSV